MNNKNFLALAQQENNDEGKIWELRKINIINYNMLLLGWIIVFIIKLLKKEPTVDLTFMLILSIFGKSIYSLKKKKSLINLIIATIFLVAILTTGWTLFSGLIK